MTKLIRVFALFLALSAAPAVWAAESAEGLPRVGEKAEVTLFTKAIEDLPVMKGLEVVEDKELVFIFGKERIAQTELVGKVDVDEVYYFYSDVLPSLGWKKIRMKLYERAGERLHLRVSSADKGGLTHVYFEVRPSGSPN